MSIDTVEGDRRRGVLGAVLALGLLATGPVQAADVEDGKALVRQWCQGCHVVGPNEAEYIEGVPMGPDFMKFGAVNAEALKKRLNSAHILMPRFPKLNDAQIMNVVAYIDSVRR